MKKDYQIALGLIALLIGMDQITKAVVRVTMELHQSITLIPQVLSFTSHRNTGAAWGLLDGQTFLLILITVAALGLFVYLGKDVDFKHKRIFSIGIALLLAGAIGNFIDRVLFAEVVDFIDAVVIKSIFGRGFPVFNIADMCLTIGMVLFGYDTLFLEPRREKA